MQVDDGERAIAESIAMQELRHPFVVALHYTFQGANKTRQTQFWSNATPTTDVCTHAQTTDLLRRYPTAGAWQVSCDAFEKGTAWLASTNSSLPLTTYCALFTTYYLIFPTSHLRLTAYYF